MPSTTPSLSAFHPYLVAAIRDEAARAADRAADYLHRLADRGAAFPPLPCDTLLELGAAFTLAAWERGGVAVHRDAGLPDAKTAVRYALATMQPGVRRLDPSLAARVVGLFADRMAWHARAAFDADVAPDAPDEDALIDAVAQFVWARRHDRPIPERTTP